MTAAPQNSGDDIDPEAAAVLLDLLLLAIIRANPQRASSERADGGRLRSVKRDLFGIEPRKGRPVDGDLPELLFMAREYIRDRGEPQFGKGYAIEWASAPPADARSMTQLATQALRERLRNEPTARPSSEAEKIRNLQQKFEARMPDLLKVTYGRDGLFEDVFWMHLREVTGLLQFMGIKVAEPANPLRDAKAPT